MTATTAEAMDRARAAVVQDKLAGLCVGVVVHLKNDKVYYTNAGDTSAYIYTDSGDASPIIPPQEEYGEPKNYLGRQEHGIPNRIEDASGFYSVKRGDRELYIMSDGVSGNDDLSDYLFQAAHEDVPLLQFAKAVYPNLKNDIQNDVLVTPQARQLLLDQKKDNSVGGKLGLATSRELEDPSLFSVDGFDWGLWYELIKPYIQERLSKEQHRLKKDIGAKAICQALVDRPIRWPFECPPDDDASLIRVELNGR